MTAYEQSMAELVRRVEKLEAYLAGLDGHDPMTLRQAHQNFANFANDLARVRERVEKLEPKAPLCTHENYSCVKERQEVHKLVTVVQHWKYQLASSEALRAVNEALKPFEDAP